MTNLAMEYFIKLAEYASFTEAAKNLYISQPTLSRQIKNLEMELGVSLIDHSVKKQVRLTKEGEVFLAEAQKVIRQIEQIPLVLRNVKRNKYSVSIGYHSSFYNELLHRSVADCSQMQEAFDIRLKCCDSNTLNKGLKDGTFDVILIAEICMEDMRQTEKVVLSEYELCAAVSSKHVLAKQSSVKLGDLRQEKFIFLERSLSPISLDCVTGYCMASGFTPNVVGWFQDKPTLLVAVGADVGISLTLSGPEVPHTVKLIPLSEPYVRGNYYGIYLKENPNPAIAMFMDVLRKNYAGESSHE